MGICMRLCKKPAFGHPLEFRRRSLKFRIWSYIDRSPNFSSDSMRPFGRSKILKKSHHSLENDLQEQLSRSLAGISTNPCGTGQFSSLQIRIGNELRCIVENAKNQTHHEIEQVTRQLRAQMLCVIKLTDKQLRDSPMRSESVSKILKAKDLAITSCPP